MQACRGEPEAGLAHARRDSRWHVVMLEINDHVSELRNSHCLITGFQSRRRLGMKSQGQCERCFAHHHATLTSAVIGVAGFGRS
jgi:hypothetical protein